VKCLKAIKWVWIESSLDSMLAPLEIIPLESIYSRRTYSIANGMKLSVYFENGQIEYIEITLDAFFNPHHLTPDKYVVYRDYAVRGKTWIDGGDLPGRP